MWAHVGAGKHHREAIPLLPSPTAKGALKSIFSPVTAYVFQHRRRELKEGSEVGDWKNSRVRNTQKPFAWLKIVRAQDWRGAVLLLACRGAPPATTALSC